MTISILEAGRRRIRMPLPALSNGGCWTTRPTQGKPAFFLLSDVLLGTGGLGGVNFDNSGSDSNVWQKSTAQTWCKNFYSNNFSSKEQNAVLETTKSDTEFTSSTHRVPFAASENILNGDKVFFLSADEAENSTYGFTDDNARIANYGNSAGMWWLRSPHAGLFEPCGPRQRFRPRGPPHCARRLGCAPRFKFRSEFCPLHICRRRRQIFRR